MFESNLIIQKCFSSINRFGFVLILLVGICYWVLNSEATIDKARLRSLNRLMPNYQVLVNYHNDSVESDFKIDNWKMYSRYFQKVTEYIPQMPDAYGLLGFVLSQQSLYSEAENVFLSAIEKNSGFFWSHYNLGLLYMQMERYDEASASFSSALQTQPQATLMMMIQSKLYQPILQKHSNPQEYFVPRIKQAYRNCAILKSRLDALKSQENLSSHFTQVQDLANRFQMQIY